jgi:16S rRNA (cytosine1402-N4)-methyltransferase
MALRIAVNRELEALEGFLDKAPAMLKPGGRLSVIAFHSLEDRIVKQRFKALAKGCTCPPDLPVCRCAGRALMTVVTAKAIKPGVEEIQRNPMARSARLRVAERCADPNAAGAAGAQ